METQIDGKSVDIDALIEHMVSKMPKSPTVNTPENQKKIWDLHDKLRDVSLEVPYMAEAAEIWKLCNSAFMEIERLNRRNNELKVELLKETFAKKYGLAGSR